MGVYEDTLEDIEKTFRMVPSFMKAFPKELLISDWPSWKKDNLGDINLERASLLLSTDEMVEEMLNQAKI